MAITSPDCAEVLPALSLHSYKIHFGRRNVRTIILTLICHYSGMNGKVVFSIPFLLDQEVILLRHSLLMDQVPVFLPMEPRLAPYGRPL